MLEGDKIYVGKGDNGVEAYLDLKLANRHGLVTGATGTGKTVTLQMLAEGFSDAGVAVFASDIKGDLSGIGAVGEDKPFLKKRVDEMGIEGYAHKAYPTVFWDVFGEKGHPVRATVNDMGPLLLGRMLELNEVQEGVLNIAFRVASDEKMPLDDLADLRAIVNEIAERGKELTTKYGNVATASVGAIQRRILVLEEQGAGHFFGLPALEIKDFVRTAPDGRGIVNVMTADKLMEKPRLYAVFLLWLLSKLWQTLPEVGDQPKPKLVFFFDEAHLLFNDAPKALLERIEQIARLVRSKGVGIYFVTQNPMDVPNTVSAQLGNRVQHALRAFTPQEQKAVETAAKTFRQNPDLDTAEAIKELKVGEALVSFLENKGEPAMVQRVLICPPQARIGPLTDEERRGCIEYSPVFGKYEDRQERDSAKEMLEKKQGGDEAQEADASGGGFWGTIFSGGKNPKTGRYNQGIGEMIAKDMQRTVSRTAATMIKNIILKSLGMKR